MTGGRVSGLKKVGGSSLEPPASGQRLFRNLLLCLLLHCLLCGSARARARVLPSPPACHGHPPVSSATSLTAVRDRGVGPVSRSVPTSVRHPVPRSTTSSTWQEVPPNGASRTPSQDVASPGVLAENHREAAQVLRDAFEDAVLMGVEEAAMRRILADLVAALPSPKRAS